MGRYKPLHPASNLSADSVNIVGRKNEIVAIKRLLSTTRLLTLTGTGGVGKTCLATYTAAHVQRAFPDGVWLVELASLQDDQLLAMTVAETLGAQDDFAQSPVRRLVEHLRTKQMLLVLDNCEHLVEACALLVTKLLSEAPKVHLMATSREALSVPGEALFIVSPLKTPPLGAEVTERSVLNYDALALLAERAKGVAPDFDIVSQRAAAAQLCRILDGIPLAIELAAVWLRVLSLEQIISRVGNRLQFLIQGYRTAPPRHQTLRAAIEWSFDLCSPPEQILWERLSVFAGEFDLPAAEQVCSDEPLAEDGVLPLLASLHEKSILITETLGAVTRYRILESLRQFGLEQLADAGAADMAVRERHVAYYLGLAERHKSSWFGPDQLRGFDTIAPAMPNVRAALDFCLKSTCGVGPATQIFTSLYGYWIFFGAPSEARYWFNRILEHEQLEDLERFRLLAMGAMFAIMQCRRDLAQPLMEQCRALSRCGGEDAQAMTTFLAGRLALLKGDYGDAVDLLEQATTWYEANHDALTDDSILNDAYLPLFFLTVAAVFADDPRANRFASRCREIAERAGARGEMSMALWVTGIERWHAGDAEEAISLFHTSLRLERDGGYTYSPVWTVESLAWAAADQGKYEYAAGLIGAAEMMRRRLEVSLGGNHAYSRAHQECVSSIRASLGESAFRAARERGASIDFREAIAYALQEPAASRTAPQPEPVEPQGTALTSRELEVAELVAKGVRNKDIAERLVISQRTAEGHVEHILEKMGFTSRAQIASWYVKNFPALGE